MTGYTIKDLVTDYGQKTADDYLRRVKEYAKNAGFELHEPAKMARIWIERDGHKKELPIEKGSKPMFDTHSCKNISSMLFAMGRMEHAEMRLLPGALFREKAWIKGNEVIIDWDVPGITREQIARIEYCLDMKLIIKGISIEEELPF